MAALLEIAARRGVPALPMRLSHPVASRSNALATERVCLGYLPNLTALIRTSRASDGFANVKSTLEEIETTAREAADEARNPSAYGSLWMFVALLLGAFTASLRAVFGGRQRDNCSATR